VAGAAALLLAAHRHEGLNVTGAQMKPLLMAGAAQSPGLANKTQSGAGKPPLLGLYRLVLPALANPAGQSSCGHAAC
jgi:hypothetical protein